jgi:predicted Rossmann fold flavoprotein
MATPVVVVAGGGAAGFFAAITCAQANPAAKVCILEKSPKFLTKVRISGGGRCNVTHDCFDPAEFVTRYPRGRRELLGPFQKFQASDTVAWFEARGVQLKTEEDGRMFPVTDQSQTIIDCLLAEAARARITLEANTGLEHVHRQPDGTFRLSLSSGAERQCHKLLLATGGCRTAALASLAVSLGHTIVDPVPSLFTFHLETPWVRALAGVSLSDVEGSIPGTDLRERGPLLLTHWGLSGPMILRLSAWGARRLAAANYQFPIHLNWLPHETVESLTRLLQRIRETEGAKMVLNASIQPLPFRLWEQLVLAAGLPRETRWAGLSRAQTVTLIEQLRRTTLPVTGKSLNKDEFVTCGGIRLTEVNFKTMESRRCPGLYFAGELLDLDGITGGFNFQAAWTTGWLAGQAMAAG